MSPVAVRSAAARGRCAACSSSPRGWPGWTAGRGCACPAVVSASSVMWVYACLPRPGRRVLAVGRHRPRQLERLAVEPAADRDVVGLHADDRLDPGGAGLLPEVVRPEDVAVVGHRQRRHAPAGRPRRTGRSAGPRRRASSTRCARAGARTESATRRTYLCRATSQPTRLRGTPGRPPPEMSILSDTPATRRRGGGSAQDRRAERATARPRTVSRAGGPGTRPGRPGTGR